MYADFSWLGPLVGGIILIALILSIIGSFIIDSVVLLISMFVLHIENKTTFFWKHIWGIFFLADYSHTLQQQSGGSIDTHSH